MVARTRTWIVVVNYNGLADTQKCLQSIANLTNAPCNVVVVDNHSRDRPVPALRRDFPWCDAIANSTNGGWAGGNNVGIRYALARGADQIILLNNDTVVAPNLVDRLIAAAAVCPDYGVIGPVIRFLESPQQVMTDGCTFNDRGHAGFFQRKPVPIQESRPPDVTEVDIVNGCCMMINARVFARVGLIDERFFLIHEESDFCLRARRAGFRCGVLGEALVWHKGSSSFKNTGQHLQRYYDARNLLLLLRKHGKDRTSQRGRLRSVWEYVKYVYYRYAIEREQGQPRAADAVLEGVSDALQGRYGPRRIGPRSSVALLRPLFERYRQFRAPSERIREKELHANSVC